MDEILGFHTLDTHGSPIPDKNGKVLEINYLKFTNIKEGQKVKLCAVENNSTILLTFDICKSLLVEEVLFFHWLKRFLAKKS